MARPLRLAALALVCVPAAACGAAATTDDASTDVTDDATDDAPGVDAPPGAVDAAVVDAAPPPDATPTFDLRMFVTPGNHYRFDVSVEQAALMDQGAWGNPVGITVADDLTVTLTNGTSQSFGAVGLRTVGQSTFQEWARKPNLRIDSNEVQPGVKIGGVEHFRFNNGRVGGLFREAIALRIWDALGYRTPATNHAWVSAPNQWGEGYERPYEIIEVYKQPWCDRELDGGCANMWEGVSSFASVLQTANSCQLSTCDNTRLQVAADRMATTPAGPGFMAATADIIDWDAFHSFQCLSWFTGTGDDVVHNANNLLIVERDTGLLQFYPYSSDISGGIQVWNGYYTDRGLTGISEVPVGCQADPVCWQATLDRCDELLTAWDALDPATTIVQPLIDELSALGMMDVDPYPNDGFLFWDRPPPTDAEDAAYIRDWYANRSTVLRADPVWN